MEISIILLSSRFSEKFLQLPFSYILHYQIGWLWRWKCNKSIGKCNILSPLSEEEVQHPRSLTTFGCGSVRSIFINFNSAKNSSLSLLLADSLRVLTATMVVPFLPSIFRASHFHTCPKHPSPDIVYKIEDYFIFWIICYLKCHKIWDDALEIPKDQIHLWFVEGGYHRSWRSKDCWCDYWPCSSSSRSTQWTLSWKISCQTRWWCWWCLLHWTPPSWTSLGDNIHNTFSSPCPTRRRKGWWWWRRWRGNPDKIDFGIDFWTLLTQLQCYKK